MNLTTKGRYAVTAMLDLTINSNNKAVALMDISDRHHISLSYLEQLFAKLRRHHLVTSLRGPGGGYKLTQAAEKISIFSIIRAVDEVTDNRRCKGQANCHNNAKCITHNLWEALNQQIDTFLLKTTLADLTKNDLGYLND